MDKSRRLVQLIATHEQDAHHDWLIGLLNTGSLKIKAAIAATMHSDVETVNWAAETIASGNVTARYIAAGILVDTDRSSFDVPLWTAWQEVKKARAVIGPYLASRPAGRSPTVDKFHSLDSFRERAKTAAHPVKLKGFRESDSNLPLSWSDGVRVNGTERAYLDNCLKRGNEDVDPEAALTFNHLSAESRTQLANRLLLRWKAQPVGQWVLNLAARFSDSQIVAHLESLVEDLEEDQLLAIAKQTLTTVRI